MPGVRACPCRRRLCPPCQRVPCRQGMLAGGSALPAIVGSCLCRDRPSSALSHTEQQSIPRLLSWQHVLPAALSPLSPHSNAHWPLLLRGNAFLSLRLDALCCCRTFARLSIPGLGLGKPRPTWSRISKACGGQQDLPHRAAAKGRREPRLTGAASLGAGVIGKGKVPQDFWALVFTGNISCHRIRLLIFLRKTRIRRPSPQQRRRTSCRNIQTEWTDMNVCNLMTGT